MADQTLWREAQLPDHQDSQADLRPHTWHLSGGKSRETLCGMATDVLQQVAMPWTDVRRPCSICDRLGRPLNPVRSPIRTSLVHSSSSGIGDQGRLITLPKFTYRSLLGAYSKAGQDPDDLRSGSRYRRSA